MWWYCANIAGGYYGTNTSTHSWAQLERAAISCQNSWSLRTSFYSSVSQEKTSGICFTRSDNDVYEHNESLALYMLPTDTSVICKGVKHSCSHTSVSSTSILPLFQYQIEFLWAHRIPHQSRLPPGWTHPLLLQPIRAQSQPPCSITHGEEQSSPWRRKNCIARGRNNSQNLRTSNYHIFILSSVLSYIK